MKKQTAIVTGGGKGIGFFVAERLASQGWNLFLCGRSESALNSAANEIRKKFEVKIETHCVDFTDEKSASKLIDRWQDSDLPEGLVCNAANYGEMGYFSSVDFGKWKESFNLNFFAVAELIQAYVKKALRSPAHGVRRKIVVLSGGGLGGSKVWPGASAYLIAKAALYRLVESVDAEVHSLGFDINCVAPGAVKTGMTDQALKAGDAIGPLFESQKKVHEEGGDSPDLAAQTISALLGPASNGISGRLISAKWDQAIAKNEAEFISKLIRDPDLFRLRRIDQDLYKKATE